MMLMFTSKTKTDVNTISALFVYQNRASYDLKKMDKVGMDKYIFMQCWT